MLKSGDWFTDFPEYIEILCERLVHSVVEAKTDLNYMNMRLTEVSAYGNYFASGEESEIVVNRDY